ncbi:unnamed protein product [Wickerhamomyces anomalus]
MVALKVVSISKFREFYSQGVRFGRSEVVEIRIGRIWWCGDTWVVCESDKMNTTARQRDSHVQRGTALENRGGNTTFGVMIGIPVVLFEKL